MDRHRAAGHVRMMTTTVAQAKSTLDGFSPRLRPAPISEFLFMLLRTPPLPTNPRPQGLKVEAVSVDGR